jgi:hypothetical protein
MENLTTTTMELQEINLSKFKKDFNSLFEKGNDGTMTIVSSYFHDKSMVSFNDDNYIIDGDARFVLEIIETLSLLERGFSRRLTKNNFDYSVIKTGTKDNTTIEQANENNHDIVCQLLDSIMIDGYYVPECVKVKELK